MLEEFDRSGMSGQAFAKWAGIKYPTFATWVQKRRKGEGKATKAQGSRKARGAWVEVVADKDAGGASVVVELPGGGRAIVSHRSQAELVGVILRRVVC